MKSVRILMMMLLLFPLQLFAQTDPLQVLRDLKQDTFNPAAVYTLATDLQEKARAESIMVNPRYRETVALLPMKFGIADNFRKNPSAPLPPIQNLIDSLYLEIFSSPSAQKICQDIGRGNPQALVIHFGISPSAAAKVDRVCRPQGSLPPPVVKLNYLRQYIFAVTEDEEPVVGGWTNARAVTLFILKPNQINRLYLLRLMIHEMAMQVDQKDFQSFPALLMFGRQTIQIVEDNICPVMTGFQDLALKFAFGSLRAEMLEDQILKELGYPVNPREPEEICGEHVLERLPDIYKVYSMFEFNQRFLNGLGTNKTCPETEVDSIANLMALRHGKIRTAAGKVQTACEFMMEPDWGNYILNMFGGGPRPPIGNGWGSKEENKSLLKGEAPEKADKLRKTLNDMKQKGQGMPGIDNKQLTEELEKSLPRSSGQRPSLKENNG